MEKTYTWIEAREVATNGAPNDRRDNFESSRKSSWDNDRGQKSRDNFSPYRGPNHGLLSSLSKSPREIPATKKVAISFEQPSRMLGSRRSRDMSKYCYFREDHGHDTNDYRQLRSQIKEAVKPGQLSHLVKGIKKRKLTQGTAISEVLLEITIGDNPLSRSETLNFVIIRSNSPHNMLLRRTIMQKMRMVVLMIHGAVKFHTTQGIEIVFSTHESDKIRDGVKKIIETSPANTEGVLSCTDVEEKIVVNRKYPEQTVTIRKQLPEHFKEMLRNLLRINANAFAWTHVDMTGIPRTIKVDGKPF
ncbi:hypothetical protein Tco_1500717 [Tanacetum coccineum]